MWRHSVFRQPITAAKFITKSSLFVQLPAMLVKRGLKLISEQKAENISVAQPVGVSL
jgi:hypothetical protein